MDPSSYAPQEDQDSYEPVDQTVRPYQTEPTRPTMSEFVTSNQTTSNPISEIDRTSEESLRDSQETQWTEQASTEIAQNAQLQPGSTPEITEGDTTDPNTEFLEDLKNNRDLLRNGDPAAEQNKATRRLRKLAFAGLGVGLLVLVSFLLIRPGTKAEAPKLKVSYALPADIDSKPNEEKAALNIIKLARDDQPTELTKTWLGALGITASDQQFKDLIASYADSADGKSVSLVEKKVGKTNLALALVPLQNVKAVSFVFKSGYFGHTNSLYTKVNVYQLPDQPNTWKFYLFEFKAQESDQPLKAEL